MEAFLGDPGSIDQVAGQLRGASGTVDSAESHLSGAVSGLVGSAWQGPAANAFAGTWATYSSSMTALTGVLNQMAGILTNLAGDLRAAQRMAQDAEDFAHAHGLTVGADGQISAPAAPAGVPPDPTALAAQAQAVMQAQGLMDQARSAADRARTQATGALSGLSVPQVQPGVTPAVAAVFAQGAGPVQPGSPPSFAQDLWNALKGNVLPNPALGGWGIGLFAGGRTLKGLGGVTSWMTTVQLGRFAPRNELGQFISPNDMSAWQRAAASMDGDSWIARPFMSDTRGVWSSVGEWGGRAGTVLAFAGGALSQWEQDNGKNLDTSERVGRTAYRSAVAGGGAIAGAEAGAELGGFIGSFAGPEGTVIGGFIGGVAGGVVGSGAANWVVDHTVDAVGHATDATVHWVGDAGSTVVNKVGDLVSDLNPF